MNKHPQPSPPLASKAASENDAESAPLQTAGNAGALAVFDPASTRAAITARFRKEDGAVQQRAMIVEVLGKALEKGRAALAESLSEAPVVSRPITRGYAALHDGIVDTVYWAATTLFHPNSVHTQGERLAVLAVGGYGRFEMAPHSDIDLLFLTPHKITPWVESIVETMLYVLWDLKLKVGQASRTLRDCIRLAREDFTIRTSMVEQRVICGDSALAQELKEKLWSELFKNTAPEFIEAKLNERAQRHRKQGGQRYVVEPNVKEGKGGLRDLQSLFWIAKYMHGVNDAKELVALGMFSEDEFETFVTAEDFLWAVRCHLHLIADRAVDQLSFDMQVAVAERMGYADGKGRRAVEHFMQDYFLQATRVGELTRIFLTGLEETHVKSEPVLQRFFKRQPKVRAPFAILQNRITVQSEDAFLDDKLNILRLFEEALRTGSLIHPDAMRIVSANLHLIDDDMRERKEAVRIFHDLLLKHGNPERSLRRMNELGVLAAFLPEFEPIVAMMQFNMYHHYTVDEHTIQTISHLAQIEREELVEELPVASKILSEGLNRKVLYTALLLHDIGKGRPEDHSVLGAQIARRVCPRLGLNAEECETVEWLVRYHLLMSDMAQKRDIADPRTVRDFAKAVKTVKRMDLLLILTVCDIRGVGPGTWNNWKAALLRALYRQTRRALEGGMEALNRDQRGTDAKRSLREALKEKGWPSKDIRTETARHNPTYWQGLHLTAHLTFAELLRNIDDTEVSINATADTDRDATRICFAMADHPGLFSRITGALALAGANVVDARSYTSSDGYVTAIFWCQDSTGQAYETSKLKRLTQVIDKTLKGGLIAREALAPKDKLKKREKAFDVPTTITFDNEGSEIFTIIEVDTRDRPGLLHDLTRTMAASNINIEAATIATYGEQVVDSFYVKDLFGLKLYSEAKQKTLEARLREAIITGSERADHA